MTIVDSSRPIMGGVDTHLDKHVAAALDANGGVLGVESFPTTPVGFVALHDWLAGSVRSHGSGLRAPARMARACSLSPVVVGWS